MTWQDAKTAGEARAAAMLQRIAAVEAETRKQIAEVRLTAFEDEHTYNLLHQKDADRGWSYGFHAMVTRAAKRVFRQRGLRVLTVTVKLDDYFAWLAKNGKTDSTDRRAEYIMSI